MGEGCLKSRKMNKIVKFAVFSSMITLFSSCTHPPSAYEKYKPLVASVIKSDYETKISKEIFSEINSIRRDNGLDTLMWDDNLGVFAVVHSIEMGENNYVSHNDYSGRPLADRVDSYFSYYVEVTENCAFQEFAVGENIKSRSYSDIIHSIVNAWMSSQGHRRNILDSNAVLTGVGTYIISDTVCYSLHTNTQRTAKVDKCYRVYITQDFSVSEVSVGSSFNAFGKWSVTFTNGKYIYHLGDYPMMKAIKNEED